MSSALIELSNGLADAVERAGRSVVAVNEGGQSGVSGTLWRDAVVVTAEHTIRGEEKVTLVLPSGDNASATVAGRDPSTDLAVLKLETAAGTVAELADPGQVRVGQIVLAIGRRGRTGLSASYGVIGARGGAWRTWSGGRIDHSLRLDLTPYPGFSGGPLVDVHGRVLGINTSGPRRSVLTIPAPTVNRVVDQLLAKGRIARGYLGAGLQPVRISEALQKTLRLERDRGLLVVMLAPGGPADTAGIMIGDIVVAVPGQSIHDLADLQAVLDPEQVGNTFPVRILRGGALTDVKLTVGERGEREP
jgi:S1-C subfamily serine protease